MISLIYCLRRVSDYRSTTWSI